MLHTQPILRYYKPRSHYMPSICVETRNGNRIWFTLREFDNSCDLLTAINTLAGGDTWVVCASKELPHGAILQWDFETMIDFDEVVKEFGEVAYAYISLGLDNDLNDISERLFDEYDCITDFVREYAARYHMEFCDTDSAIDYLNERFKFVELNGKIFVFTVDINCRTCKS